MARYQRRSKEEMIKDLEEKLEKLKSKKDAVVLDANSDGVKAAIDAVVDAASANNVKVADILMVISRAKRTGLVMTPGRRVVNA